MGKINRPDPVKLICGLIFKDASVLKRAEEALKRLYGKTDLESPVLDFNYTDYYKNEFGDGLKRKFISFDKLIAPDKLSAIKIETNKIESRLSAGDLRRVNIDPGFVDLAKLILATTKDYNHRIYLSKGVFAEVTLTYQDNSFRPWAWTYRDYRSPEYIEIFDQVREIYSKQIKCAETKRSKRKTQN